jgi:hypothetical protein
MDDRRLPLARPFLDPHPGERGVDPVTPAPGRDVDAALRRGRLLAERHALLAALPADPTAAIRAAERELDGLSRWWPILRPAGATTQPTRSTGPCSTTSGPRRTSPASKAIWTAGALPDASAGRRKPNRPGGACDTPQRRRSSTTSSRPSTGASTRPRPSSPTGSVVCIHSESSEPTGSPPTRMQHAALTASSVMSGRCVVVNRHAPALNLGRGPSRERPWLRDAPIIERGHDMGLRL